MEKRKEKTKESIQAVLPILFIVLLLSFTVAPVSASILLEFMIGAVFVIIGMLFFSMGAEMSMSPMGERVGGSMLKTKKLWVILLLGFFSGSSLPFQNRICRCLPLRCRRCRIWC